MRKKETARTWWLLSLIVVAGASILIGYFYGMQKGREGRNGMIREEEPGLKEEAHVLGQTTTTETESPTLEEVEPPERIENCDQIEESALEFFQYLDDQTYIERAAANRDTYGHFKRLTMKLLSQPPVPAGEGADSKIITKNIFHFFRLLDRSDIRLIRDILKNEADTLEMNMDIFYRWLMPQNRCPEPEEINPPLNDLYQYAGFLLNTIGGRSYLYRRPIELRLLVSYYCLLIINEADKRGMNNYGIDIFPLIQPIKDEIALYPNFYFQDEYLVNLEVLTSYYQQKR